MKMVGNGHADETGEFSGAVWSCPDCSNTTWIRGVAATHTKRSVAAVECLNHDDPVEMQLEHKQ